MKKNIYNRGVIGHGWYNFTEALVYALVARPTPGNLIYESKIKYGEDKLEYINTYCKIGLKDEKKPVLIYIHGGGWISGITEMRNRYMELWAQKGYFTASVSYSYAPEKVFPEPIQQCFAAVDFICDHADEWKLDLDNVIVAGESAGGYYISHVASAVADFTLYEKQGLTFRNRDKLKIKALVSLSGCYNFERLTDENKEQSRFPDMKTMARSFFGMEIPELREWLRTEDAALASPVVTKNFPPVYMAWATRDKLRFEAFDMAKDLRVHNIPYRLFKVDDISAQHAWTTVPIFKKSRECFEDAYKFCQKYIDA